MAHSGGGGFDGTKAAVAKAGTTVYDTKTTLRQTICSDIMEKNCKHSSCAAWWQRAVWFGKATLALSSRETPRTHDGSKCIFFFVVFFSFLQFFIGVLWIGQLIIIIIIIIIIMVHNPSYFFLSRGSRHRIVVLYAERNRKFNLRRDNYIGVRFCL